MQFAYPRKVPCPPATSTYNCASFGTFTAVQLQVEVFCCAWSHNPEDLDSACSRHYVGCKSGAHVITKRVHLIYHNYYSFQAMLRRSYHNGMARPGDADGGDGRMIWRVSVNILNNQ
jgi:hypothetical protein